MRIVFRVDSSTLIGSGHVMRCRNLARELVRRGNTVIFVGRRHEGHLLDFLRDEFPVIGLRKRSKEGLQEKPKDQYAEWLACSQREDAEEFKLAVDKHLDGSIDWVVVDHYGLDEEWEHQIRMSYIGCKILVIDDLANRPHDADMLIDQNYYGQSTKARYAGLVLERTRLLLGPEYALLGEEYTRLKEMIPSRTYIRRVLIFMGGSDLGGVTEKILRALKIRSASDIAYDVVLSNEADSLPYAKALQKEAPHVTVHVQLGSLLGLIARADFSIGAGGVTAWERACMGLPGIVVPVADNQLETSRALCEIARMPIVYVNELDQISYRLDEWKADLEKLYHCSCMLSSLVSGDGCRSAANLMGDRDGR